jgi:hypothetical protein
MEKNHAYRPAPRSSRRLLVLSTFATLPLVTVGASAVLMVSAWRTPQTTEQDDVPQTLTPQEKEDIKAAVSRETDKPVRYFGLNRNGIAEVFMGIPPDGGHAYRVKKTDGGWRVVEMFTAF